jgi:hypothetical protein
MDKGRGRVVGALLIVATLAAVAAAAIAPALTEPDYLARFAASPNAVNGGALLYFIAAFASAGIAIAIYPLLQRTHAGLALGAVVFRSMEAVMYLVAAVLLLSLLPIGEQLARARAADLASLHALASSLVSLRDYANDAAVLAFSLGASLYYVAFFQTRLVPRWLSGWGIAGTLLILIATLLSLFTRNPVTGYAPLILPIAAQELVLAVWLIVRGFAPAPGAPAAT